jgi:hypothetical protein
MIKQIFSTLVTGIILALIIAVPARAITPGTSMRANIPFDFMVRGKTLPAGSYEIRRISDEPDGLLIRNINDKHDHAMFETEPVEASQAPNRSEVVFHRYGDTYFLSEVLTAGEQTGRELSPARQERQLRREMASNSNNVEPQTVTVAVY